MAMRNPTVERHGYVAVAIVAAALAGIFVGAILPTPLYPLYRHAFGFSGVTLTLVYSVYVLGNLTALLLFGRLSDQIGRRVVALPAIGVGIASTLAFGFAGGTPWLFVARALSGLSTGLASGTATAWIAELYVDRGSGRAARIASGANFIGCAIGPLFGGLLAQFAAAPLRLPFGIFLILLVALGLGLLYAPETMRKRTPWSDISLKPRLGVPADIRLAFIAPAVTGFATFSLIGFYSALIPNLLGETLHLTAPAIAGGIVCALFGIAAIVILVTGRIGSRAAMLGALALLPPSVWLLVGAEAARSLPLLIFAAAIGGIAGGFGYRGSLEVINRIAPSSRRSEVVSSYMIVLFAGNSVPVVGIGVLSALAGAFTAHLTFAAVITALAGIAGLAGIKFASGRAGESGDA